MMEMRLQMARHFADGPGQLDLALTLPTGSLTVLVGASGAGKTTLLRLLAGLETPDAGQIMVENQVWFDADQRVNLPPQRRSVGFVFQDAALFPHMTIRQNIAYAAGKANAGFVDKLLVISGLSNFSDRKPAMLSGGQRQRVALARALVRRPKLLLLDEPFSALDPASSHDLAQELHRLHRDFGTTTIWVSHQPAEAQPFADQTFRMTAGRLQIEPKLPDCPPETVLTVTMLGQQKIIQTATRQLTVPADDPAFANVKPGDTLRVSVL